MLDETRMTIRIPGPIKSWMDTVRQEEGCSINYQIIRALQRAQHETKKAAEHTA